ncbi:metal ABC transporter permease [Arcanobacterium haemolyticum]|uniref:ABC-3 protein n=1 Tax=Arcanobacterium haemolyticum (strain ATCC 9345 / DSM 20595 / CCM 5947 / CCUG 17215 / LMG 16163 / NBRC 15585 / NCTC 8452 / 11018) TaxID=644284 RepID=D7BNC3_ARCHD|nr:metal ABC transporter permease [Arcanobacterium haemolyticum]ADH92422.1 ABC-3 protein [Arcanobacterium haemolyticum DSM 20595]QCX46558.1 metal ABC transporter permease [Arcanobacterium haemolyticum]SQH28849.1 Manganese transport system membrane protein mntB [Arcanobacterium haemolyticum]
MLDFLSSPLMVRAIIVAVLVGLAAPVVGTYLVQRRLTLLGDGIGHIALTGVAMGWLAANAADAANRDAWAVPGAIIASILGALLIEWMRNRGHSSGDVALALVFYGGIAGGVILIGIAGGTTSNLTSYLFGSISTVTELDVLLTIILCVVIGFIGLGLRPALFVLCHDEEHARASGLPTVFLSALIAVTAALTVSVAMRVVGALLVSALMIIPVAISHMISESFRATMHIAMAIGVVVATSGLITTYYYPWSPGATIVLYAVTLYLLVAIFRPAILGVLGQIRRRERN